MTIEEFKTKMETSEELKAALKEAGEKGDDALEAFLEGQGVEFSGRSELSEDALEAVTGGYAISKKARAKLFFQDIFGISKEGKEAYQQVGQAIKSVFYK